MANNKVQLSDGTVIIDLTGDTATTADVASGKTFHLPDGTQVNGTLAFQIIYTGSSDPSAGTGIDGDIYVKVVS